MHPPPASTSPGLSVLAGWTLALLLAKPGLGEDEPAEGPDVSGEDWFRPEVGMPSPREALGETHVADRWIYHDLDAARRRATESGKPLLVVFRCVPCGAAPQLDGPVCTAGGAEASAFEAEIRAAGGQIDSLLDRFVTVRMVKMNGVNHNVFQFDRDVPHVAMFMNADGAVYGRYGTRVSRDRKKLVRHRLSSFQVSLRRALELHGDYPRNRAWLAGKRAAASPPAMVEDLPDFRPFPEKFNPAGVKNCIHCHTVGEAETRQAVERGRLSTRDIFPFPPAQNLGLEIDVEHGLKVASVREASIAGKAGLRAGDVLRQLAGQALTSEADIQWALHHAADTGELTIRFLRGEETIDTTLTLRGNWRRSDGHWRASLSPLRPGFELRPDPQRVRKGASPEHMGLGVFYPRGPAARAGLRGGDLLIAVDGRTDLHLEADFLEYLHLDRPPARTLVLTVLRKSTKLELEVPLR